jgi:uroporphyrinogen decarboxylase
MATTDIKKTLNEKSPLRDSRFLRACRGEVTDCTPIWLMRQAGRYMSEYRAIRAHHTMLEVIQTPKLAAEVTLQPIDAFDLDAAIIFSDILPPLIGMGLQLDFVKGSGPQISTPIQLPDDVDRLTIPKAEDCMGPTLEAISIVRRELDSRGVPLIGFAGAPFTLACYAIQGSGSKTYEQAKQFMYTFPDSWSVLMNKLVDVVADYLIQQARSGASALQVFDSWAGILSVRDYERFIKPFNSRLLAEINSSNVPIINFSTGTSTHLNLVAECGGDVIGVDWRLPLRTAWDAIGGEKAIQGNLDPTALLAPWDELKQQVDAILDDAVGRSGHIFNLGHGILPPTPIESVKRLADYVHERTG